MYAKWRDGRTTPATAIMAPKLVPSQTKPTDPSINASEKRALLQQTNLAYDGGEEMPEAMDETPCRINYCTLCLVVVS